MAYRTPPPQLNSRGRGIQYHGAPILPSAKRSARSKIILYFGVPFLAICGTIMNYMLLNLDELGIGNGSGIGKESMLNQLRDQSLHRHAEKSVSTLHENEWCDQVAKARSELSPFLHIQYPCETMKPAVSAIVCMLTDGAAEGQDSKVVFTARDYINGVMTLGASLQGNIDPSQTHQLLLLREGFELPPNDKIRLQAVGWTIGTAPNFPLPERFLPRFPRYKTTYTKVTAIGLSEYKCVMLMDADTLVIGDIKEILKCNVFRHPNNRLGGTIDWYQKHWRLFNTGSILWKPNGPEMDRVFNLTKDSSFMQKFSSDQEFLNNVYADRWNNTLNWEIVAQDTIEIRGENNPVIPHALANMGSVVPISWEYNAQTHAEVENTKFWETHRSTVRILHFTEKKGWRCERRYEDPPPIDQMPQPCKKEIPLCYCREAHLYWRAFDVAEAIANQSMSKEKG